MMNEELKGKKVAIHASIDSVFAGQVSALLRRCGCDVARLPLHDAGETAAREFWQDGESAKEHSFGTPRTAIALSEGRPVLVNYPSDVSLPRAPNSPPAPGIQSQRRPSAAAVLNPITGEAAPLLPESIDMQRRESVGSNSSHRIEPFSFLMIDDDVRTLQVELLRIRSAVPLLRSALGPAENETNRPNLGSRTKSNPQMQRILTQEGIQSPSAYDSNLQDSATAIIYFASLSTFRTVREVIRPMAESISRGVGARLPEIIVVPKPAGIRRVLTTLHTALHKPLVDPFFQPLATSPMSPMAVTADRSKALDVNSMAESFSQPQSRPSSPGIFVPSKEAQQQDRKELSSDPLTSASTSSGFPSASSGDVVYGPTAALMARQKTATSKALEPQTAPGTPSERHDSAAASASSTVGGNNGRGSSPRSVDALEYFGEAATRLGSSATTGMVVQSPDGRPAGIYFRPRPSSLRSGTSSRSATGPAVERPPASLARTLSTKRHVSGAGNAQNTPATPASEANSVRTRMSRTGTTGSVHSEAPSIGALLTPQVGIEQVLNGPKPPVLGSLSQHLAEASQVTPAKGHVTRAPSERSVAAAPKPVPPPAALESPVSPTTSPLQKSDAANVAPANGGGSAPAAPDGMPDPGASKMKASKNPLAQARQSFAMQQVPSRESARPSAQPQAGLLIGAGFSQTQRRGTGQRRAPVREAVLPPIKVLIVEGE